MKFGAEEVYSEISQSFSALILTEASKWLKRASGSEGNLEDGTAIAEIAQRYLSKISES